MHKRKKNTLTLETKLKILKRLDKGVNGNRLAQDFNVTKSAISYIKSKKNEIMAEKLIIGAKTVKDFPANICPTSWRFVMILLYQI